MSNDLWRWADSDGQQRTVRLDELRAALAGGHMAPNTPVWRDGWAAWQPANEVPELTAAADGGANGVVLNIPPPPLAMVAVQHDYEKKSESLAPAAPNVMPAGGGAEPPPPPRFVPASTKVPSMHPSPAAQLKTQFGGSAAASLTPGVPATPAGIPPAAATPRGMSLPTAIGLPPPPELAAQAAAASALRQAKAAAEAQNAEPARGTLDSVEELSGSALVDLSSAQNPMFGGTGQVSEPLGFPAPTDPIVHGDVLGGGSAVDDEPLFQVHRKRRDFLQELKNEVATMKQGKAPQNKVLVGVVGGAAVLLVIGLLASIASLASGTAGGDKSGDKNKKTAGTASAAFGGATAPATTAAPLPRTTGTSAISTAIVPPTPSAAPSEDRAAFGDCTVAGESKPIAPRAVIASAIEAQPLGNGLALGFASSARDAVATTLDPGTLAPTATVRIRPTGGDIRRVTPMLVNGHLTATADVERRTDHLGPRRVVSGPTLLDVGIADGALVWAPHGKDSAAKIFSLDGDAPVEALRAIPLASRRGIAVTFRRENAIYIGVAKGESVLEADGDLSKVEGLGPGPGMLGSPALAATSDGIVAAWADRASASDEWRVRWAKVKQGGSTRDGASFTPPSGGLGGNAMSPSVASLGGGRFLLAWTEGPVSSHQIRAIAIGADGSTSGTALTISPSGDNAGQPAIAIGPDGRGVVAYLAAKGKALEVHATPITCAPR